MKPVTRNLKTEKGAKVRLTWSPDKGRISIEVYEPDIGEWTAVLDLRMPLWVMNLET